MSRRYKTNIALNAFDEGFVEGQVRMRGELAKVVNGYVTHWNREGDKLKAGHWEIIERLIIDFPIRRATP